MSRSQRDHTVEFILRERVSAIIRTEDRQLASDAMQAAVDGGFRMVEFTLTTPGALELVSKFAQDNELLVGAGTVLSPQLARDAVSAGARFLVSPIVDPEVVAEAGTLDVVSIPGGFTPTEMEKAYRSGADFVKVFPAPAGGVEFIRAIRGPLPHLRLFPTAGVTSENVQDYLHAGCAAVGFVRSLFVPQELAEHDFQSIRARAASIVRSVAGHRLTP